MLMLSRLRAAFLLHRSETKYHKNLLPQLFCSRFERKLLALRFLSNFAA